MSEMERFLESFRRYLPPHWVVWVNGGRVEVRDRADRDLPLLTFDAERNSPQELFLCLPDLVGSLINLMHREFCALRDFAKEAVAGCAEPGELAGPVMVKVKSTPISWELSEGVADAFPGVIVRREKESKPCPLCNGTGKEGMTEMGSRTSRFETCSRCGGSGTIPKD